MVPFTMVEASFKPGAVHSRDGDSSGNLPQELCSASAWSCLPVSLRSKAIQVRTIRLWMALPTISGSVITNALNREHFYQEEAVHTRPHRMHCCGATSRQQKTTKGTNRNRLQFGKS